MVALVRNGYCQVKCQNTEAFYLQIYSSLPIEYAGPSMRPSEPNQNSNQPPSENEIRVEYHPSTQKVPQHFSFYDFDPGHASGISANVDAEDAKGHIDREPWRPFSSRIEFDIADLILETHMNTRQTDGLITLIKQCIKEPHAFTLNSSKDLQATWSAARLKLTSVGQISFIIIGNSMLIIILQVLQFKPTTLKFPYPKPTSETTMEFELWDQPLWDWCDQLLSDRNIVSNFRWNAERIFKYSTKLGRYERCIDEPWTADAWWNVQVSIVSISMA